MINTSIFIVDDHELIRKGLKYLIEAQTEGYEVIGEAKNGREAVRGVRKLAPDIVLMDIMMPELNGIEAVQQITSEQANCAVIAVSAQDAGEYVTQILGAGARGYLHKDSAFEELHDALDTVSKGNVYLGKSIANSLLSDYQRAYAAGNIGPEPSLSRREREVLQLVAEGHRTSEIADKLYIGIKTVESHRSQILRKLQLNGIAALTRYAIRNGIINP